MVKDSTDHPTSQMTDRSLISKKGSPTGRLLGMSIDNSSQENTNETFNLVRGSLKHSRDYNIRYLEKNISKNYQSVDQSSLSKEQSKYYKKLSKQLKKHKIDTERKTENPLLTSQRFTNKKISESINEPKQNNITLHDYGEAWTQSKSISGYSCYPADFQNSKYATDERSLMMSQQKQREREDKLQKKYFESIQVSIDKKEIEH